MENETNEAQKSDVDLQPIMTRAEAEEKWLRVQKQIVLDDPALAKALWGDGETA